MCITFSFISCLLLYLRGYFKILTSFYRKRICDVMVIVVAYSAVDCGFDPKTILLVFTACPGIKEKEQRLCWLRIRIMCPSGATCLTTKLTSSTFH